MPIHRATPLEDEQYISVVAAAVVGSNNAARELHRSISFPRSRQLVNSFCFNFPFISKAVSRILVRFFPERLGFAKVSFETIVSIPLVAYWHRNDQS